ncbi:flagellar biosynthetic protein FliO [Alteromonas sp. a30]|uniref:flagellar biosynthetic protein FliO n=1 Tax=Alteromonas sp. a30 TaxID=2730917 RepID=UPI00227E22CF|nr:flagellar biosynthetic protein FliO [Alteromonas sp. a30]
MSVFLSLIVVIGIVFMLAYLLRRLNVTHTGSNQMHVVATMMVGTRERMMVVQVGDEQHLIGITANNINHLAKLEQPISGPQVNENLKSKFQSLLTKQQTKVNGDSE